MKNKFTFTVSVFLLCLCLLACNFKFGDTSENKKSAKDEPTTGKKSEKTNDSAEGKKSSSDTPQKIGGYHYQRFDYSVYLISPDLSAEELTKTAQKLHDKEPEAFLVLVDDDAKAEQYITYHEQAEEGTTEVEFPREWADEHIAASVIMFLEGEKKWYLTKGYGYEKIAELK